MDAIASATNDEKGEAWPLQHSWSWTKLGEIAAINPPTSFDGLSEVSFVPMAAVSEETGTIDMSARRPAVAVAKGYMRFMNGDVIFAKITPCMENGKVAPVTGVNGGYAAGSTEFHVFRSPVTDQRYLWYWLVSRSFRQNAKRNMSGSAGQLRVPIDWLRDADFALAPLAEQRRIVARIDALFAEIAEGEAALKEARKGLEVFRRALVKAAVTGELTKDWRAANLAGETGHDLLARLSHHQKRRAITGTKSLRLMSDAMSAASDVQVMLDAANADAARSKQSILKAAFEGRLVPQDPTDEPASTLLDRLRAGLSANHARSRKRRKTDAP